MSDVPNRRDDGDTQAGAAAGGAARQYETAGGGRDAADVPPRSRVPEPPREGAPRSEEPKESQEPGDAAETPGASAPRKGGLSLSTLAIRRPVGTLMIALSIVVLGLFFLRRLPVDLLPSITYPRIGVRVEAPGIAPEVAVEEITRPLEEALAATEGVVQVYSQTREGQVQIDLFFEPGGDVDQALNDATAALNRGRGNLPDYIEQPTLFKFDPSQLPVIEFALTSPQLQGKALRLFADEELARELAVVQGVASVDVAGGAAEEVRVFVDADRLQALGVGLNQVLNAIAAENQDVSGGRIEGRTREALTRTVGRFRSVLELERLSFEVGAPPQAPPAPNNGGAGGGTAGVSGGAPPSGTPIIGGGGGSATSTAASSALPGPRRVYLRDFARVVDATEDQRVLVYLNREPAVKISVLKQPDANTVEVVDAVKAEIGRLKARGLIPEDARLISTLDESQFIRNALKDVAIAALSGAGLAALSVLLFLGSLRQTFIVIVTIPLGLLLSLILMGVSGFSLNIFSLAGLALGIGAVDPSIVILENIAKGVGAEPGKQIDYEKIDPEGLRDVSEERSRQVESALVAGTGTNLIAVTPFLFIGGFIALLFNELILVVLFTTAAALLAALTVVPMLTSRLLAVKRTSGAGKFWPIRKFNEGFAKVQERYGGLLERALDRRVAVIVTTFAVLGGGLALLVPNLSSEILPRVSNGQARLIAQFPPGTPLPTSDKIMEEADRIFLDQKETVYSFSTVGGFVFGQNTSENALRASSTLTLQPDADVEAYVSRVNRQLPTLNLVDVRLRLAPGEIRGLITSNTPVRGAEIDVILQGNDPAALERAGYQVLRELGQKAKLASYRPNADPPQPELQILRDRERAADLGLSTQEIGQTIATAIEGTVPTQLQRGERLIDIRVELDNQAIRSRSQLERLPLFVSGNRQVRLSDVASIREERAPGEIQRINQRSVFILAGNLNEGATLGDAIAEAERVVKGVRLPQGVSQLPSNAQQSAGELSGQIPLLGALAIFLVYIIMAVQYDSLIDPLVILFTIPLALAGSLFGLWATGTALGATALIGAVLLIGIITGNGIVLVERANQVREEEQGVRGEGPAGDRKLDDRRAAMLRAAPERLRPILMTAMTAVLGILPLALGIGEGAELLKPLGIVVFAGLTLGTLLTLFIVPCFYLTLHGLFGRVREKLGRKVQGGA